MKRLPIVTGIGVPLLCGVLGYATAPQRTRVTIRTVTTTTTRARRDRVSTSSAVLPARPPAGPASPSTQNGKLPGSIQTLLFYKSLDEIFRDEPRDDAWASRAESTIQGGVASFEKALLPYGTHPSVECRSHVCEVSLNVPVEKQQEAMSLMQGIPLGEVRGPSVSRIDGDDTQLKVTLSAAFADGRAAPESIEQDLESGFAQRFPMPLDQVRAYIDQHPDVLVDSGSGATP